MKINDFIISLSEIFIEKYNCCTSNWDINNGLCDQFAVKISEQFPEAIELSTDMFFQYEYADRVDDWGGKTKCIKTTNDCIWSKNMLNWHGKPFSFEKLRSFEPEMGSHVWIKFEGKHYDAECTDGVNFWYELPIFKNIFVNLK